MHARLNGGSVQILTRRGNDWTDKYPPIGKAIAGLPAQRLSPVAQAGAKH
jgi:ATP-dependent DNA ligase